MATVGNMASTQLMMAKAMTNYSNRTGLSGLTRKIASRSELKNLNRLTNTPLNNKNPNAKAQYSNLYKDLSGIADSANGTVALRASTSEAKSAADDMTDFANKLSYGGEYNQDEYAKLAQNFAESYNGMLENVSNSDSSSVLQKGVMTVNAAKVYRGSLERAGFSLGSDNKLTFDKESLGDKVSTMDIKTTFGGNYGFSNKISQKAQQIGSLSNGKGMLTYNALSMPTYAFSMGSLLNFYA
ncbi:MAG: hypothetical protein K2O14_02255 [Oscillospiraceae bacterium]|nr:hypothetical protein [Oscillospiraceae bacterium]